LMDRYDFTLQVEDPAERWGNSPTRYREFGETYSRLVRDRSRLMFDINVVRDRLRGVGPTGLMSGTELALAAASAAGAGNGRVGIYSESSLRPEDRALLPAVLGSAARLDSADPAAVAIDKTVRVQLGTGQPGGHYSGGKGEPMQMTPVLDGERWQGADSGEIIVPAGEHRIGGPVPEETFGGRLGIGLRVKDISAEVTSMKHTPLGVEIGYSSPRRAWVTVSREPRALRIDGRAESAVVHRGGSGWLIQLPAGAHWVEIEDATAASAALDVASVLSSQSIVWLGGRFVLLLGALYAAVRVRRGIRRLGRAARAGRRARVVTARDPLVRAALRPHVENPPVANDRPLVLEGEPDLVAAGEVDG